MLRMKFRDGENKTTIVPGTAALDLGYLPAPLVVTTLPHRDPHTRIYTRQNGPNTLEVQAGPHGMPWGKAARDIHIALSAAYMRTAERRIVFGESCREVMGAFGRPWNGKNWNNFADQINRVCGSRYIYGVDIARADFRKSRFGQINVADNWDLWHMSATGTNVPHIPSGVIELYAELSETYIRFLERRPVPIPLDLYLQIQSPLVADLLVLSAYRVFRLRKPNVMPWRAFRDQLGTSIKDPKNLRREITRAFLEVLRIYPELKIRRMPGGVEFRPSPLLVSPR